MKFRPNVAALIRTQDKFIACCRADYSSWQCVQGGIESTDVSPIAAIQRELDEELGLKLGEYKIISQSKFWRRYYFTKEILAKNRFADNVGQEQMWFLVELTEKHSFQLDGAHGEFSHVEICSLQQLIQQYSQWKRPPFYDFCRELGLI
jgi:putative (di)nucleoside polyphosphate hydrolase